MITKISAGFLLAGIGLMIGGGLGKSWQILLSGGAPATVGLAGLAYKLNSWWKTSNYGLQKRQKDEKVISGYTPSARMRRNGAGFYGQPTIDGDRTGFESRDGQYHTNRSTLDNPDTYARLKNEDF